MSGEKKGAEAKRASSPFPDPSAAMCEASTVGQAEPSCWGPSSVREQMGPCLPELLVWGEDPEDLALGQALPGDSKVATRISGFHFTLHST